VGNPELLDRFYQEARSAGALQHPNIVTVHELGKEGDSPFIAMEFLEGESLDQIIRRRLVLALSQKVGYIVSVCRALDYAHRRGVVHRDVKPGNVMLTKDGTVKVVDFGIARLVDTVKTQTNMMIGTIGYMSPQQFRGERADPRSDIWALGVMFYELLCYRRPFDGADAPSLILNVVDEKNEPTPIRDIEPDCPPELAAIVNKMLQKNVSQRFQSMEEILFELEPVWRNLQEDSISELIADSEVLIRSHDYSSARDLLRRALQIDSRNDRAKALLERVNTEIKRIQIRSQVKMLLEQGQNLLRDGRYQEAREQVDAALKLDPTFVPTHELLAEVQHEAERARQVQESLQLAKQRLAEGALTEATREVGKVLDLDAGNPLARGLQKQIHEQQTRRAERQRLASILQRARKYWADQQLDECIALLTDAQREFHSDPEIAKLLEAARQDQAEHSKQQKLAEARGMLAAQRFDAALAIVDPLSKEIPGDLSVQKLRELIIQEKEEMLRHQKLQSEVDELQSLVNAGKFSEAVSLGQKLLREFPREHEITELVKFARDEAAQLEQQKDLDEALQNVRKQMHAGKFRDALAAAEKAQTRFPRHSQLEALISQVRAELREEENHELIQRRIAEIRKKINSGHHTEAVDLARQTLSALGPDAKVTQLLRAAEMERAQKQEKEEERQKQIATAQTQLDEGQFDAATLTLQSGIDTQALTKEDPQVEHLLNAIQERRSAAAAPGAATLSLSASAAAASGGPATEYVFQRAGPLPQKPASQSERVLSPSSELLDARHERGRQAQPEALAPVPVDVKAPSPPPKPSEEPLEDFTPPPSNPDREGSGHKLLGGFVRVLRKQSLPAWLLEVVVVVLIGGMSYSMLSRPSKEETALLNHARLLESQINWPTALAEYEGLAARRGALSAQARESARNCALTTRRAIPYDPERRRRRLASSTGPNRPRERRLSYSGLTVSQDSAEGARRPCLRSRETG